MAAKKTQKAPHIKTKDVEVSIQFRGRRLEIKLLLRPALAEQLTYRLTSKKRFQQAIKRRRPNM